MRYGTDGAAGEFRQSLRVSVFLSVSGVSPQQYVDGVTTATVGYSAGAEQRGGRGYDAPFVLIESALGGLALVLTLCALAGVLNTVVLNTRERGGDIAILKALGMTPRQVILMVLASVTVIGIIGGGIGIAASVALQHQILTTMASIAASTAIPARLFSVYPGATLAGLSLVGLVVAVVGALVPARCAARAPVSNLLAPE